MHTVINSDKAYNPLWGIAPISFTKDRLGISYSNRYLVKETNSFLAFGIQSFHYFTIAYSANYFGNDAYWYSTQSIVLAKKLSDKLSLGISFSHCFIDQGQQYKAINEFAPSIGICCKPFTHWIFTSAVRNIARRQDNAFGINDFVIAGSLLVNNFTIHSQFEKMQNNSSEFTIQGEYAIKNNHCFVLRTSSGKEPISCGFECTIQGIRMLFLYSYHIYLGSSPELSMYKSW